MLDIYYFTVIYMLYKHIKYVDSNKKLTCQKYYTDILDY